MWPRPSPPFSLADLQDVYAGMVRSDGTNDASVLDKQNFAGADRVRRARRVRAAVRGDDLQRVPRHRAGRGGDVLADQQTAVSLFTFRFADRNAAAAEFARIDHAVTACAGRRIEIVPRPLNEPPTQSPFTRVGTLSRFDVAALKGIQPVPAICSPPPTD